MEREAFLANVRRAAGRAVLPEVALDDPGLLVPELPDVDVVEHFVAAVRAVDGVVHFGDPIDVVVAAARRVEASSHLSWDEAELAVAGVDAALDAAGVERLDVVAGGSDRLQHQAAYESVRLGVTGSQAAFAESGTIVVLSGPGRPRMASLVPEVHVALVRRTDIHRSLAHWAAEHSGLLALHTNVVFISGPSRTGDIEMKLNVGVHGPREFHVVLV